MSPSAYARQGKGERLRYCVTTSDLGLTLIAWTARGIACILFGERSGDLETTLGKRFAWADIEPADKAENADVARVVALIDDPTSSHDLPLDIRGTAFQERVWKALTRIPPGSTRTYREIAEAIGEPAAVRAVANACGANRLPVAIPCHRVVRSDGGLGGYAFGEERKRRLLGREKA
jgi:AraC family transcriptional regulator of adaptative response/methylated-DNA-[protein]-cysteine methyltransferase